MFETQLRIKGQKAKFLTICLLSLCFSLIFCPGSSNAAELDPDRYISIDQIKPGMAAYCLTVYKGTKIEKFDLEVLGVVRNGRPGMDWILVQGTDERFLHTAQVHGCSGSPVYIEGKMAGALSHGYDGSKDPFYIVTPIAEMLEVGPADSSLQQPEELGFTFDYSVPLDFAEIDRQMDTTIQERTTGLAGATALRLPLVTSGLPTQFDGYSDKTLQSLGFIPVAGIGGGTGNEPVEKIALAPGSSIAVPIVTGDIRMAAIGTVTEVIDDKVYALGHGWLGYGPIDLPMATARIHTVIAHILGSFKLGTAIEVVGAIKVDQSAAVYGEIGAQARMIPLKITINRYNDIKERVYNCKVADNRVLTAKMIGQAIAGSAFQLGKFPPDHMIKYKASIETESGDSIALDNISTTMGLNEMLMELVGSLAMLMNNPYEKTKIASVNIEMNIEAKNAMSQIWSVDLSHSVVKPGQQLDVSVILESFLTGKKRYNYSFNIPENIKPGKYDLLISGSYGYMDFLRKTVPHRFMPQNMKTLTEALNYVLSIKRDKLYCLILLPAAGVSLENAELPDLPPTKAMILNDAKRTLQMRPFPHWIENTIEIDTVVVDKKILKITVEQ